MRGIAGFFRFVFGNCKVELTASSERSRKWSASPILRVLWQTSVGNLSIHMGCCSSKAPHEPEDPLTGTGICQKQLYPPHTSPTGFQVRASTASWIASLPFVEFSTTVCADSNVFLAFFESQDDNKAAAAYAIATVHQVFQQAQGCEQGNMQHTLQASISSLDEGFLADTHIPSLDRACSAASGVIVYLDFKAEKVWAGQVGATRQLVIGQLFHGLAVQRTAAVVLKDASRGVGQGVSCIGAGRFKRRALAEVYNKQQGVRQPFTAASASSTAHIVEQRLHAGDEHLMIASQGLWEVVSPDDAALRMHFHLKANATQSAPAVAILCDVTNSPLQASARQAAGAEPRSVGHIALTNSAESLVLYAMQKVAAKASRTYQSRHAFSEEDLRSLPFKQRPDGTKVPPLGRTPRAGITRRDVHGDMSAIVLSLRWPATSLNQALELPIHTPPPKGKFRSPEQQAASERARHRWGQVKMLHVEFYRARRMMLLSKWWKACSEILAKGRVKARQLEEQLWVERRMAVKISPALHIMDQYGRVVHPEDIDLQLPTV
ncbi:TPA: hypothetical protein ACH3X2_005182 [Trebouxia sp. C0005]